MASQRVAERLAAVGSAQELHALLTELASTRQGRRWRRPLVLRSVPTAFQESAERYFDGEEFQPDESRVAAVELSAEPLDAVVKEILRAHVRQDPAPAPTDAVAPATPSVASGPLAELVTALDDEITESSRQGIRRYELSDLACTDPTDGHFRYRARIEPGRELDVGSIGTLRVFNQAEFQARVVHSASGEVEFSSESFQRLRGVSARFVVDRAAVPRALRELLIAGSTDAQLLARFRKLNSRPSDAPLADVPATIVDGLNEEQRRFVRVALAAERSYLWGPPGTGKTATLAALMSAAVARGERVLLLSAYNVAVDNGALAFVKREPDRSGAVIRFGRRSAEITAKQLDLDSRLEEPARAILLPQAQRLVAALEGAIGCDGSIRPPETVIGCLDRLGRLLVDERKTLSKDDAKAVLQARSAIRAAFRAQELTILSQARIVATTVTLALLSDKIRTQQFDHVLVDEASVLGLPNAALLGSLRYSRVTFAGDPFQLPAVVQARRPEHRLLLGRHPFESAGLRSPKDAVGSAVFLPRQYRMAPQIRMLVSRLFYGDQLIDAEGAPEDGQIVFLESTKTGAIAQGAAGRGGRSKQNTMHRRIVERICEFVKEEVPGKQILVLTPYYGQRKQYSTEPTAGGQRHRDVRFETIHAAQGHEAEVVILDLVAAGGRSRSVWRFLDDVQRPETVNLLNVACSRAKTRLYVVASWKTIEELLKGTKVAELLSELNRRSGVMRLSGLAGIREALAEKSGRRSRSARRS